jgi:RNA-binding signal recognition particle 68
VIFLVQHSFVSLILHRTIYEKLAEAVADDAKDIYLQRCGEISPNIRYCAYNIGDESAKEDLIRMRMKAGQEDQLTSRLDVRAKLLLGIALLISRRDIGVYAFEGRLAAGSCRIGH